MIGHVRFAHRSSGSAAPIPARRASRSSAAIQIASRRLRYLILGTKLSPDRPMLVREVILAVREDHEKLRQALLMIAAKRDDSHEIDPRRLGDWLAGIQDRLFNGRRLTRDRKISREQAWRLDSVRDSSPNSLHSWLYSKLRLVSNESRS
jgi:hypothetical protein